MTGGWLTGFLIALAPLLVLVLSLVCGRYPGERAIDRCRRALTSSLGRRPVRARSVRRSIPDLIPIRGGRLIAASLAGRGPPATS